tara:strand:- start:8609 stop:9862 length:1254 start_codon:yes stop_codon:yes gene_type:complete
MVALIQQQRPNLLGAIKGGFTMAETSRLNNLKSLAAEQDMEIKQQEQTEKLELNTLYKLAEAGDPQATERLSMVAPKAFEGLEKYKNYRIQRGAQLANSIIEAPEPVRPKLYQDVIKSFTKEFREAPNVPSEYSPEALSYLKSIVTQAREVESVAKEEFQRTKPESGGAKAALGGGATGALITRWMEDNPGGTFSQGLSAVQGLSRKGLKYDSEGNIVSQGGFVESQQDLEKSKAKGKEVGKDEGIALARLRSQESKMPGITKVVEELRGLSKIATFTAAGTARDKTLKELGQPMSKGGIARVKYMAVVDNQILPLLRDTFGSQFTENEGKALRATLGDPGFTPEQKESVLDAFIAQKWENISAAKRRLGINEGESSLPNQTPMPKQSKGPIYREGQTSTGKSGEKYIFRGGKWNTL